MFELLMKLTVKLFTVFINGFFRLLFLAGGEIVNAVKERNYEKKQAASAAAAPQGQSTTSTRPPLSPAEEAYDVLADVRNARTRYSALLRD